MTSSSASVPVHASSAIGRLLFAVALSILCALPVRPALAQDIAEFGILVIDIQRIRRDAAASVSVREQSAALRSELEVIIAERAKEISLEEAALAEERERLLGGEFDAGEREAKQSAFAVKVREFEKKVFANRDFSQREGGKLQALQAQAQATIGRNIAPILTVIMREKSAKLLLDKSQVILSADALDVTDEVLERLNAAMPTLVLAPVRPGD